jgi:hypothetical protein
VEQITGPVHGYWLACYTVETDTGHFAYAKLCIAQPDDVWDAGYAVRKVGAGPYDDPAEAIRLLVEHTTRKLSWRAWACRTTGWCCWKRTSRAS